METIRVLHVCHSLGLGGTEKTAQLLAQGLDRTRFTAGVFAFAGGPRARQLHKAGVAVRVADDLLHHLREFAPHVVHLHRAGWADPAMTRPLQRALQRRDMAVVETNVFGRRDNSPHASLIDRHLFVSEFCRRRYGTVEGVDVSEPRYGVLEPPVVTKAFSAVAPAYDRPVMGRISRADPGKWSSLALDCIDPLAARIPGLNYRIIGATVAAQSYVQQHGLQNLVTFLDPVEDDDGLTDFFDSLCVLAHANDTGESFGMVIAEAMAAGLPVVTHRAEGLRDNNQCELVRHGETGYVADGLEEYVDAVARLLSDPAKARRMGKAGRAAIARYDVVRQVERLQDIYEAVLADKGIRP